MVSLNIPSEGINRDCRHTLRRDAFFSRCSILFEARSPGVPSQVPQILTDSEPPPQTPRRVPALCLPVGDQHKGIVEAADDSRIALAKADGPRDLQREAELVALVGLDVGVHAAEDVVRVDRVRVDAVDVEMHRGALLVQQLAQLGDGAGGGRGRADVPVDADVRDHAGARQAGRRRRVELGQALRG